MVYSAIVAVVFYRSIRLRDLWPVLMQTARTTINIFTIIAGAAPLSKVLTFLNAPQLIFGFVERHHLGPWEFLIVVSAIMFVLGMFMEAVALNVMTTPILAPIAMKLGIDPVHYGIVLIFNIEIALITPPVGLNLFVLAGGGQVLLGSIFREVVPFAPILVALLLVCIFVPQLSLAARPPAARDLKVAAFSACRCPSAGPARARGPASPSRERPSCSRLRPPGSRRGRRA